MEMVNTNINGDYEIILPKHRADRPEWGSVEGWEKERLNSINEHVKEGDIFYYIGAECFDFCGLISKWGCDLVCIEPNSVAYPNAKAIWEANNLKMPLACFLGFATDINNFKKTDITYNGFPDCVNGEINPAHGFKELKDPADIAKITIDLLVELTGFAPKHISLDIEGSEKFALEGAVETLKKYKPNIWLSAHPEFSVLHYNYYIGDLRQWIRDLGYKETILAYSHELHLFYESI